LGNHIKEQGNGTEPKNMR